MSKRRILKDLFSNRLFLGALAFFVLMVGGSELYYWHVRRTSAAELKKIDRLTEAGESKKEQDSIQAINAPTAIDTLGGLVNTREESDETDIAMPKGPVVLPNDTQRQDITGTADDPEDTALDPTLVSPYGFGPYPEIPEGFGPVKWPRSSANHELMKRVRIKLWEEGIKADGSTMDNGKVYPIIKGIIYVRWKEIDYGNGPVRYLGRFLGDPDDTKYVRSIKRKKDKARENFTEADVPGLLLVSFEDAGIDPYTFLDLP